MISLISCWLPEFISKENVCFEYQFVYPTPKGSELIVTAPFRDWVFRDNQFAIRVHKRIFVKNYRITVFILKRKILMFSIITQLNDLLYW